VLLGHELDWLQALGLAPRLAHCVRCGRAVAEDDPVPLFSVPRGGCICLECQPEAGIETMATDPPVMRLLRTGRSGPSAVSAIPAVWDAAARLLGSFLNYHLDLPLASRPIPLNILAR